MVCRLSKQRTERMKHAQETELQRELLRFAMEAWAQDAASGRPHDLVDLTLALRGGLTGSSNGPYARINARLAP
jgi:hypothetical protein